MSLITSGIYLLNKQAGISSFQAIKKLQQKLNIKKIGHCGTLDPFATGLIIVLTNEATKLSNFLLSLTKDYKVKAKLYTSTNTGDSTGTIINPLYPIKQNFKPNYTDIKKILESFDQISYLQHPPLFSAIKIAGKPAYKYARQGESVKLKPRWVTIHKINFCAYNENEAEFTFKVQCSKGTYIRSLVNDLGQKLQLPIFTQNLERIQIGPWSIDQSQTIEEMEQSSLISIGDVLKLMQIKLIEVDAKTAIKIHNGVDLYFEKENDDLLALTDQDNNFYALYSNTTISHQYHCQRLLRTVN